MPDTKAKVHSPDRGVPSPPLRCFCLVGLAFGVFAVISGAILPSETVLFGWQSVFIRAKRSILVKVCSSKPCLQSDAGFAFLHVGSPAIEMHAAARCPGWGLRHACTAPHTNFIQHHHHPWALCHSIFSLMPSGIVLVSTTCQCPRASLPQTW